MPGFDRTGPMGAGSMTGGRRGLCDPAMAAGARAYIGPYGYGGGPGLRCGFSGGFCRDAGLRRSYGRGYGWYPPAMGPACPSVANEMEMLKVEADHLKKSLEAINTRIDELGEKSSDES